METKRRFIKPGDVFGYYTVLENIKTDKGQRSFVRCVCGTEKLLRGCDLTGGKCGSCGCKTKERFRESLNEDTWSKRQEKSKKTFRERYGVSNAAQIDEAKKRSVATCYERYGKDHFSKNLAKKRTTSSDIVTKKQEETNLKRYGVSWISQTKKFKDAIASKAQYSEIHRMCIEYGAPYQSFLRRARNKEPLEQLYDQIINYDKASKLSTPEMFVRDRLHIDLYDKCLSGKGTPRPDFKLSDNLYLDVHGLWWHSEKNNDDKNCHFNKRLAYEKHGARILQFYEDEIIYKWPIVESVIKSKLGNTNKIGARKLKIVEVQDDRFFIDTHLQGKKTGSMHVFLVDDDGNKLCGMAYKWKDKENHIIDISRFSCRLGTTVIGGLSRLLNHVTSTFRKASIHYWVDLRYGDGKSLHQLGFNHERDINSFEWTDYIFRYHRLYSRNNRTDRMSRIFDAGQRLFIR